MIMLKSIIVTLTHLVQMLTRLILLDQRLKHLLLSKIRLALNELLYLLLMA